MNILSSGSTPVRIHVFAQLTSPTSAKYCQAVSIKRLPLSLARPSTACSDGTRSRKSVMLTSRTSCQSRKTALTASTSRSLNFSRRARPSTVVHSWVDSSGADRSQNPLVLCYRLDTSGHQSDPVVASAQDHRHQGRCSSSWLSIFGQSKHRKKNELGRKTDDDENGGHRVLPDVSITTTYCNPKIDTS
jgi:hypothetical protein